MKTTEELRLSYDCAGVDWGNISAILQEVGMAFYSPNIHQQAFEASYVKVFIYSGNQLVGFGRAISDGFYQAAIYDVAVIPAFQKKGIGSFILKSLINQLSGCNILLYATPGVEQFYTELGFRQMKTGMALFTATELMKQKGFTV